MNKFVEGGVYPAQAIQGYKNHAVRWTKAGAFSVDYHGRWPALCGIRGGNGWTGSHMWIPNPEGEIDCQKCLAILNQP